MQSVTLNHHVDKDGVLRLEIPTALASRQVEVIVIMQPIEDGAVDAMGYPIGYFENTYGICADDPIERAEQLP
ncbi:MAG: hypothetical protein SGJ24_19380 [Chloroflexota bacterium]|nr:hypothetical protein [Chloroflexota bacterium]